MSQLIGKAISIYLQKLINDEIQGKANMLTSIVT